MNIDTIQQLFKVSSTSHHTMTLTEREELFGWQKIFEFPNGYGASVVVHDFSYGLELALLDADQTIIQHPDITNDVAPFFVVLVAVLIYLFDCNHSSSHPCDLHMSVVRFPL